MHDTEPSTPERIRSLLAQRFEPLILELRDDSHKHVGHRGATSGGGHYHVRIVARAFEGHSRLEQHRLVNRALEPLFVEGAIHALALETRAPSESDRS